MSTRTTGQLALALVTMLASNGCTINHGEEGKSCVKDEDEDKADDERPCTDVCARREDCGANWCDLDADAGHEPDPQPDAGSGQDAGIAPEPDASITPDAGAPPEADAGADACSCDDDCADDERCRDGVCRAQCTASCQCRMGDVCEEGLCMPPPEQPSSCANDCDCPAGDRCVDMACVSD